MSWFKLVGSTEDPLEGDWSHNRPDLLRRVRFPWNKPPSDIWAPGYLILYAVGSGVLVAIQRVDGPPQIRPRRGQPGTTENRYPHTIAVQTTWICTSLTSAPNLREQAPEFASKYASRFRNGSHWKITDAEFEHLAGLIRAAGSPLYVAGEVLARNHRTEPGSPSERGRM